MLYTLLMTEAQTQWNQALDNLIELAKTRKEADHSPWDDSKAIEKLLKKAQQEVEREHKNKTDQEKVRLLAMYMYNKVVLLFAEQTDKLDKEGRISESLNAYALLTLRFEEFFIATAAFYQERKNDIFELMDKEREENDALSEKYESLSKQIDVANDAMSEMAAGFLPFIQEMRRRHDVLFSINYEIKM